MTRHALVVGINQYPFLQGTSTSLKTPAGDAEAIAQLLETYGDFIVERLPARIIEGKRQVDPNPKEPLNKRKLEEAITELFLPEDSREMALLFFAGHGLRKSLGKRTQGFLATSDACPRKEQWGLSLRDLREILQDSPVQQQVIWLDCCFSGELLNFKDTELGEQGLGRDRFLIAASHSSEVAYEQLDGQHGVLSGALLKGLNPDRVLEGDWITNRTLSDFVDRELKAFYEQAKISQTPQISTHGKAINLIKGINKESSANQQKDAKKSTASARKIPFVLPQLDVSTFTGRDEELSRLEELLLNRQGTKVCSIAGLAGVGGIGKSALACHFATIHKEDFPDGVIGLRVDGKDLDAIAREFARRCGEEIESEDERDAATIMQEVFAHRRILLIFDNAEDANIRALRPGGERCAVIITTRDRGLPISLDISSQGRINLSPLPDPDSLRLLEKLIGKERVAAEPEAASNLIQLAGNLPLALQIIGAQLKLNERRSLADYVASLSEERRLARMRIRGDEHFDLRVCFSLSLKQLQPEEIDFFACLSVCAEDGFSRRTAMAASGCDDEYTTQEYLDYLCRLSLLNYSEVGESRFVFHPLIRLFAHDLIVERGLHEDAAARHAQFFIEFVRSSNINDRSVASVMAEELNDILMAAQWLQLQQKPDYQFAISLQPFFEQYGYWQQAIGLMSEFQLWAERLEDWNNVVQFRIQQAKYLTLKGDWSEAEKVLQPIAEILSRIEMAKIRQLCEAMWLTTLGGIRQRQGQLDEAVKIFEQSAAIGKELGYQKHLAIVLNSLGGVLQRLRRFNEAIKAFEESAAIGEELGYQRHLAIVLNSLGGVLKRQGYLKEAVAVLQRSRDIRYHLGDQHGLAMVLNNLGRVLQRLGYFDDAVEAFNKSSEIDKQLGNQRGLAMVLNNIGLVREQQGRFAEAMNSFRCSYSLLEKLKDPIGLAMVHTAMGRTLLANGNLVEATVELRKGFEINKKLENSYGLEIVTLVLAQALLQQGLHDEALAYCQRALTIAPDSKKLQKLQRKLASYRKPILRSSKKGYVQEVSE